MLLSFGFDKFNLPLLASPNGVIKAASILTERPAAGTNECPVALVTNSSVDPMVPSISACIAGQEIVETTGSHLYLLVIAVPTEQCFDCGCTICMHHALWVTITYASGVSLNHSVCVSNPEHVC